MNVPGNPSFPRLLLWQAPTYVLWGALIPVIARLTRVRWLLVAAGPLLVASMSAFNVWWIRITYPATSSSIPRRTIRGALRAAMAESTF
jgi:hypothetical protein